MNKNPQHISVIMDGNSRWAEANNFPRIAGHNKGAEATRNIIQSCVRLGIPYLTMYAFSTENWNRPKKEIDELTKLIRYYIDNEVDVLAQHGIQLRVIGDLSRLPEDIQVDLMAAEKNTAQNTKLVATLAISYGSHQEITRAVRTIANKLVDGLIKEEDINEELVNLHMYNHDVPHPDIMIRTGGETRLSNFLLWQSSYTELFFLEKFWPDFGDDDLDRIVEEYKTRERRYGARKERKNDS